MVVAFLLNGVPGFQIDPWSAEDSRPCWHLCFHDYPCFRRQLGSKLVEHLAAPSEFARPGVYFVELDCRIRY